jgi:hypothetical protein
MAHEGPTLEVFGRHEDKPAPPQTNGRSGYLILSNLAKTAFA